MLTIFGGRRMIKTSQDGLALFCKVAFEELPDIKFAELLAHCLLTTVVRNDRELGGECLTAEMC